MEKKQGKGSLIIIGLLSILVIALGGYLVYDKVLKEETKNPTEEKEQKEPTTKEEEENKKETEKEEVTEKEAICIKERSCTGMYRGMAALTKDIQTGELKVGSLTIELKEDGTFLLEKENLNSETGSYFIIENALLLKTSSHTTGLGLDSSTSDSIENYLTIREDCSEISLGYGSFFFDPDFILTKQN